MVCETVSLTYTHVHLLLLTELDQMNFWPNANIDNITFTSVSAILSVSCVSSHSVLTQ